MCHQEKELSHTISINMEIWQVDRLHVHTGETHITLFKYMAEETRKTLFIEERMKDNIIQTERHRVRQSSCRIGNQIQNLRNWHQQPWNQSGSRMGAGPARNA